MKSVIHKPPLRQKQFIATLGRSRRAEKNILYFHGMFNLDGYGAWYLANALGSAVQMSVVHPFGFDGGDVPCSIEAMADAYMSVVRRHQANGPYNLAGFCVGGIVAYEVARRLVAQGEIVENVIMISSWIHDDLRFHAISKLKRYLPHMIYEGLRVTAYRLRGVQESVRPLKTQRRREIENAYLKAVGMYRPAAYTGPVTLLYGKSHAARPRAALRKWSKVAAKFQAHGVSGAHHCVETNAEEIAEVISQIVNPTSKFI